MDYPITSNPIDRAVPAMLDLIVAKAMAKLLEDRYQSIKELADDLREVRRQMDSSRPATALKAVTAPPTRIPDKVLVDTATIPMEGGGGKRGEEEVIPLSLAKTFDSFDATMRLMAQTAQTDDFRDYISETQKMRAYRGKIEPGSPLARQMASTPAKPTPAPAPAPAPAKKEAPRPLELPLPSTGREVGGSTASNLLTIGAIIALSIAAVALLIALLMK